MLFPLKRSIQGGFTGKEYLFSYRYQRVRISLVEVCEKVEKSGRGAFCGCEEVEKTLCLRFIHILKKVHLQQLKGIQSFKLSL